MSRTEVWIFRPNGDAEHFGDAQNSHGFAFHIWKCLAKKYGVAFNLFGSETDLKSLWKIAKRQDVSRSDRLMMSATFDRTWVQKEHIPDLIEATKDFILEYPHSTLSQFQEILEKTNQLDIRGLGINSTSISCNYWSPVLKDPNADPEDDGERRPFNLNQDLGNNFSELFACFAKDTIYEKN